MLRRTRAVAISFWAVALLVLTACTASPGPGTPDTVGVDELLAAHELDGLGARDLIDRLEAMSVSERPTDLMASVRTDAVVVSTGDDTGISLPLPQDKFYVSIAPYVGQTHDCFLHSLTTCLGELPNEEVAVEIVTEDGTVLIDDVVRTNDNGFLGLWLPRDVVASLTVQLDGRSARRLISTTDADPTCVTSLRLT